MDVVNLKIIGEVLPIVLEYTERVIRSNFGCVNGCTLLIFQC